MRRYGWAGQLSNSLDRLRRSVPNLQVGATAWFNVRAKDPGFAHDLSILEHKVGSVLDLDHVILVRHNGQISKEMCERALVTPSMETIAGDRCEGEVFALKLCSDKTGGWEYKGVKKWAPRVIGAK